MKIIYSAIFIAILFIVESCRPDMPGSIPDNFSLEFSHDTVRFDTIFTSMGSTTKIIKVYNRSKSDVVIDKITLKNGKFFRINVDGDTNLIVNKILVRARDSMYIFIKVTIDPTDESNPFEIDDKILFEYGNKSQDVCLSAFGQNAYYHLPEGNLYYVTGEDTVLIPYFIADCDTRWPTDKPHIIYGYMIVDEGDVFTLDAGSRLHFAPGAGMWVYTGGSLQINGSYGNEVIIEGMRKDADYKDLTGQWERIWLSAGSFNNSINYAVIRNGSIGLLVDTNVNSNPTLTIKNTIIGNMQQYGLIARGSVIEGENVVINNCGLQLLALTMGGSYSFTHCTFAGYQGAELTDHSEASLLLNNYYYYNDEQGKEQQELRPLLKADFTSCIIYGSLQDEIALDLAEATTGNYAFKYCNVKTEQHKTNPRFTNCVLQEPLFINPIADFELEDNSPIIGKGEPGTLVQFDIKNRARPYYPTIGAYEK